MTLEAFRRPIPIFLDVPEKQQVINQGGWDSPLSGLGGSRILEEGKSGVPQLGPPVALLIAMTTGERNRWLTE